MDFDLGLPHIAGRFSSKKPEGAFLFEAEREHAIGFAEKRLTEFLTGRHCAREALKSLGVAACDIPVGEGRQPVWPEGVCGSISHATGLAGAIVSGKDRHLSLGLDIERRRSVDATLWDHLFTDKDKSLLQSATTDPDEQATLFFSLKESFYKLQYPLTGRFLDFLEVSLVPNEEGYRAVWQDGIELPDKLHRHRLGHRFTEGHVVTYAVLESP